MNTWSAIARRLLLLSIAIVLTCSLTQSARAQVTEVVMIEEDWELRVATTDAASTAPQITTTLSPTNTLDGLYATFEINHQSWPRFVSGGMQLQIWDGEFSHVSRKFPNPAVMSQNQEVIQWTQRMAVSDGSLLFEIVDGSSSTWGPFGGQGYLRAVVPTSLENLNGYSPITSVENTGIGYAANRVTKLVLNRVRIYMPTGDQLEDNTERVVFSR